MGDSTPQLQHHKGAAMPTKKPAAPKNQLGLFAGMDPEIASEKHDEIMLWTDKYAIEIISNLFPHITGPVWATKDAYLASEAEDSRGRACWSPQPIKEAPALPKPPYTIQQKVWEQSVWEEKKTTRDKPNLVGFIDLWIKVNYPYIDVCSWNSITDEKLSDFIRYETKTFAFEVKTSIKLGELIRQINYYKAYVGDVYIVVSPDTRYKETLNEQGIYFVEYPIIPN
jgi:hypothetical protein